MKQAALVLGVVVVAAAALPTRAVGQLAGMPVWNSPRGGTGVLIAGDVGLPDSAGGNGSTVAGRVAVGLRALSLSATAGTRNPKGVGSNVTEYGGTVAGRLIGGSLIPIAVNLQGGFASFSDSVTNTRLTAALGFAIDVPVPGVNLEPWVAPGLRMTHRGSTGPGSSQTNTQFGIAGGITLGLGLFGLHAAVDYEKRPNGGHTTTIGLGAHLDIRPTLGL